MPLPATTRAGRYWRVADPAWRDPGDTSYSKTHGGRWNVKGEFGALYLNQTIAVAAANARWRYHNRAIKLFDLKPSERPVLVPFDVPTSTVVDAVSDVSVEQMKLPSTFPAATDPAICQVIAAQALKEDLDGVACRSAVETTPTSWLGEELALFDTRALPQPVGPSLAFTKWYPSPRP